MSHVYLLSVQRIKFKVPGTRMCFNSGWSRVTIHKMLQCGQIQIPVKTALLQYSCDLWNWYFSPFINSRLNVYPFLSSDILSGDYGLQVNKGKSRRFPHYSLLITKKKKIILLVNTPGWLSSYTMDNVMVKTNYLVFFRCMACGIYTGSKHDT